MTVVRSVTGTRVRPLDGWELLGSEPGAADEPGALPTSGWRPAPVPGTVAGAARRLGEGWGEAPDERDWWYRGRFDLGPGAPAEAVRLRLDGLATLADAWLNGAHVLRSESMFAGHAVDLPRPPLRERNELVIRFAALAPRLAGRRGRPRWRSRLVESQELRWHRTTLLGRIPAWPVGPAPVGPWRPVVVETARALVVDAASVVPRLRGRCGDVALDLRLAPVGGRSLAAATASVGPAAAALTVEPDGRAHGSVTVPDARRWMPRTHGAQPLYPVTVAVRLSDGTAATVDLGSTGFRGVAFRGHPARFRLGFHGVDVFVRGACWTPLDPVGLAAGAGAERAALAALEAAGANMVRVCGPMVYESEDFYRAADELGIAVWQDFMFSNLDYPTGDEGFRGTIRREADEVLGRLVAHPCVSVLCGNSEVRQQAAFLGLGPEAQASDWFDGELPAVCAAGCPGAVYWPSSPSGGELPFDPDAGDSHYQGVGAYLRDLDDALSSGVRFASECLAFANVPEPASLARFLARDDRTVSSWRWKRGSPRDRGAGWDFDDVRDEYLRRLFGVDPLAVRYADPERYLELARVTTGEVMARVFAAWRASGRCRGGLVWLWRDLAPGAGWGVVDADGLPKAAYHYLRRVWRPLTVSLLDRGLNGLRVVVHNDRPEARELRLRISLFPPGSAAPAASERELTVPGAGRTELRVERLTGGFRDLNHAYRFGPPAYEAVLAELLPAAGEEVLADDVHFPAGPRADRLDETILALAVRREGREVVAEVRATRPARAVRVEAAGYLPDDAYFPLAPGRTRAVRLTPAGAEPGEVCTATALNSSATVTCAIGGGS
jgi:beta-mannosidase